MFDWDSHYEDVVAATVLPEVTKAEATPRLKHWASRGRALAGRWAMAAAVAAGLFAAATGVSMIPRDAPGEWLASASRQTMQVLGLDDSAMPAGLLAYDRARVTTASATASPASPTASFSISRGSRSAT